jgi:hypothetical protein
MGTITSHANGGFSLSGRDAVEVYRAATIRSGLQMYVSTGMLLTRGMTITKLMALASEYTGKKYKRGQYLIAAADMNDVIRAMKEKLEFVQA